MDYHYTKDYSDTDDYDEKEKQEERDETEEEGQDQQEQEEEVLMTLPVGSFHREIKKHSSFEVDGKQVYNMNQSIESVTTNKLVDFVTQTPKNTQNFQYSQDSEVKNSSTKILGKIFQELRDIKCNFEKASEKYKNSVENQNQRVAQAKERLGVSKNSLFEKKSIQQELQQQQQIQQPMNNIKNKNNFIAQKANDQQQKSLTDQIMLITDKLSVKNNGAINKEIKEEAAAGADKEIDQIDYQLEFDILSSHYLELMNQYSNIEGEIKNGKEQIQMIQIACQEVLEDIMRVREDQSRSQYSSKNSEITLEDPRGYQDQEADEGLEDEEEVFKGKQVEKNTFKRGGDQDLDKNYQKFRELKLNENNNNIRFTFAECENKFPINQVDEDMSHRDSFFEYKKNLSQELERIKPQFAGLITNNTICEEGENSDESLNKKGTRLRNKDESKAEMEIMRLKMIILNQQKELNQLRRPDTTFREKANDENLNESINSSYKVINECLKKQYENYKLIAEDNFNRLFQAYRAIEEENLQLKKYNNIKTDLNQQVNHQLPESQIESHRNENSNNNNNNKNINKMSKNNNIPQKVPLAQRSNNAQNEFIFPQRNNNEGGKSGPKISTHTKGIFTQLPPSAPADQLNQIFRKNNINKENEFKIDGQQDFENQERGNIREKRPSFMENSHYFELNKEDQLSIQDFSFKHNKTINNLFSNNIVKFEENTYSVGQSLPNQPKEFHRSIELFRRHQDNECSVDYTQRIQNYSFQGTGSDFHLNSTYSQDLDQQDHQFNQQKFSNIEESYYQEEQSLSKPVFIEVKPEIIQQNSNNTKTTATTNINQQQKLNNSELKQQIFSIGVQNILSSERSSFQNV